MAITGFFKKPNTLPDTPSVQKVRQDQKTGRELVDVGGYGDCGFRAVAAGVLDNFFAQTFTNQPLLKKLLERHFQYFPPNPAVGLSTPFDRVRNTVSTPAGMAKFLNEFAFTLRQLAVEEMVAHPEHYRGAFVNGHEGTSPEEMRQPATWIDETAIAALANATNLPIDVRVVESGKELAMRLQYGPDSKKTTFDPVVIQLQNGHYIPQLRQSALFKSVKGQPVSVTFPTADHSHDPDMASILLRIKQDDERMATLFDDHFKRLNSMLDAREINKEQLIQIYIDGMGSSDYLKGRVHQVGLENGNQRFFADVIEKAQGGGLPIKLSNDTHETQVVHELTHAIARAIAIGHLDPEQVYAYIDNNEEEKPSSMRLS
ncbi:OTU domain-containing protein [Legionella spiritensis]|uniref:OTU domain-containing protein n=1 Tax=Legionella spiritensis TaxID=452 RepID=A0A0W0ZBX6_LEGSP|nr:OTU domain-containing protein [Legionella spiritensis]KTD66286.1 hypothetical protein Lspi_0049 [Legionella spiritensis]SNV48479.1 Predicted cysteine protease (OTU family) [Legionella spiritensis]VEG91497.1 Predicted cysteine protease (OTU family) [Legionella spiritensis]